MIKTLFNYLFNWSKCNHSCCVGRVYGADGGVYGTIRTVHTTYAAALKTTTDTKPRCRQPYAATQHLTLRMMGVCARNMSS